MKKKALTVVQKTPAKVGRPSSYKPEQAAEICDRIAQGESLRHICMLPRMPSKPTVLRWLEQFPEFRTHYAHARELQADHFLEQIQEIAHDGRNDWEVLESERTGQDRIVLNAEHVQRSRLRVDTLKWVMSKLAPKKYGEKLEVDANVTEKVEVEIYIGGQRLE
jgi:hypothetical protein